MKKKLMIWLAMALLAGACVSRPTVSDPAVSGGPAEDSVAAGPVSSSTEPDVSIGLFASLLVEYGSCAAFLDRLKAEALERVGPYGFDDGAVVQFGDGAIAEIAALEEMGGDDEALMPTDAAAAPMAPESAGAGGRGGSGPAAGVDYSTTNVQEAGVDEPDLVKTDGRRILALAQGVLHYIDASSGRPGLVSSLELQTRDDRYTGNHQMFLSGDTALLMSSGYSEEPRGYAGEITLVRQIDISQPESMRVVSTLTAEGRFISARLVRGQANLVLASDPGVRFEFVYPSSDSEASRRRAEMVNRLVIQESTLEDWMPRYELTAEAAGASDEGMLVDCSKAYAPREFSGFSLLSVLAFDLSEGIRVGSVATVVSGGDTVYSSQENLYAATQRWIDWAVFEEDDARRESEAFTTNIHRFAIGGPDGPVYEASGSIDGYLLNQFSMSEHNGYLRVASTDAPAWGWWADDTESRVDVLEQAGRELRVVGSVGGLGRGERIFAVRFMGDVGYVVTFRQTDPLYTIDLSDPADPRVMGELKILGYSAYLHPIGDGLLLGVGQDADEEGRVRGTQVSIFDVSDLSDPLRIHQYTLEESSSSEVEFDHRAFLYWAPTGTVVLPVGWTDFGEDGDEWRWFNGARVLEIDEDSIVDRGYIIVDRGYIDHRPSWAGKGQGAGEGQGGAAGSEPGYPYFLEETIPIRRSLVVGQDLYTLSDGGLKSSDLESLSELAWIEFPFEGYGPVPEPR